MSATDSAAPAFVPGTAEPRPRYSSARRLAAPTEVWAYRELLRSLVVRDLKVKYQRSVFGFLWTFLNPLVTVLILIGVFSYVVRIPIEHYWAFLLSGYFVWNFISQVIGSGTLLFEIHSGLSRSVPFPKEVLVLTAGSSRLAEFLVEIVLILAVLALFHHGGLPVGFALLPVLFLLQFFLALGLMMPVATASAYYHDIRHVIPIALTMLFYLSPVFYPVALVPDAFQPYYFLNPFVGLLTLYHQALYEGVIPPLGSVLIVSATTFGILVVGHAVFRRHKRLLPELV